MRVLLSGGLVLSSAAEGRAGWGEGGALPHRSPADRFEPRQFEPIQLDFLRQFNLRATAPLNTAAWLKPDLDINLASINLPVLRARGLDSTLWTYQKTMARFDPAAQAVNAYAADISFHDETGPAPGTASMRLDGINFKGGALIPPAYRKKVTRQFVIQCLDELLSAG